MNNSYFNLKKLFSQENLDRIISGGSKAQIVLLAATILLVLLVFSIIVIFIDLGGTNSWTERIWIVYNNFVDPGHQIGIKGFCNRTLVIFVSLLGSITLGGLLISTISNIIERRVDAIRSGKVIYKNILQI